MQRNNTEFIVENSEPLVDKSTLEPIYRPLMDGPSMIAGRCFICGRRSPLEQHHYVWRSWGKLYRRGLEMRKPTITLCGFGSNLYMTVPDKDGKLRKVKSCHGMAHHKMLHFRFVPSNSERSNGWNRASDYKPNGAGRLQYLITDEPTEYVEALDMDGWKNVHLIEGGGLW